MLGRKLAEKSPILRGCGENLGQCVRRKMQKRGFAGGFEANHMVTPCKSRNFAEPAPGVKYVCKCWQRLVRRDEGAEPSRRQTIESTRLVASEEKSFAGLQFLEVRPLANSIAKLCRCARQPAVLPEQAFRLCEVDHY